MDHFIFWIEILQLNSSVCKQLNGKMMNHVSRICFIETFLLMKLTWTVWSIPKLVWVRAKRASTTCNLMYNDRTKRWAKCFATSNTIESFSKLIKIAQFYFSVMALLACANMERFFPWCIHIPKRKRNLSGWTSFYSIKTGVQYKTCFVQAVS